MSKHTVLDRTAPTRRGRLMLGLMALLALLGVAPASASEADLLLTRSCEPVVLRPRWSLPPAGRTRRLRARACSSGW